MVKRVTRRLSRSFTLLLYLLPILSLMFVNAQVALCENQAKGSSYNVSPSPFPDALLNSKTLKAPSTAPSAINHGSIQTIIGPVRIENAYDLSHIAFAAFIFFGAVVFCAPVLLAFYLVSLMVTKYCLPQTFKEILPLVFFIKLCDCGVGAVAFEFLLPLILNENLNVLYLTFGMVSLASAAIDSHFTIRRRKELSQSASKPLGSIIALILCSNVVNTVVLNICLRFIHAC